MAKNNLILIGAGGHARSCIETIEREGNYQIRGLVGLGDEIGLSHFGYDVIATDSELSRLAKHFKYALVTLGQIHSPSPRMRLYELSLASGFLHPIIVSPSAHLSPRATISSGTIIMHGAVVNAGAIIGKNCIINTNAIVEHDSKVEDHCHISTGVILNGDTSVGTGSFIGSGTVLKEGISVGQGSLVGMGLTLRHNLPERSKYLGGSM